MSITELIPVVQNLPRTEKFQLLHFLLSDMGREEGLAPLDQSILGMSASSTLPIWTPFNVPEATVATLAAMLEEEARQYSDAASPESYF